MSAPSWSPSIPILLLVSVLLPPLGFVLLWTRSGTRLRRKLLGTVPIAALAVTHLVLFFGLRMEMDGSGMFPIFSFHKPQSHFAALEASRGQPSQPGPAAPVEVERNTPALQLRPPQESLTPPAAYWTGFRGPRRDGHYEEMEILTAWPPGGLPLLWRQPIGGGYASFAVAAGKAFTIEQRRQQEVVAAYAIDTGRELWTHSWDGKFTESMGGEGPRATPTWDDGRLYALGARGQFRCLQANTGNLIWRRDILSDNQASNLTWGMAASPLIIDEKVIVLPGGPSGKSVVAYHKLTGEPLWKSLDDKQAYTSPIVATFAGRRQILVVSAQRALGLTVEDGSLLWDYPWTTQFDINSAQPILLSDNRFFISAAYDHGAAVVEITKASAGFQARTVWQNNRMKNKFTSSVLHQGHIYGLDESMLACVNAQTGELKWKGGRYGYGQLLLASGHLIVLTESGDLVLVKAFPERHQELARFSAIAGKTWNHPSLAGGLLLVRNTTEMACFRIAPR